MCAAKTAAVGELSWFFLFQSGVIRVLVAVVRMIRYLWARDSTAWLLGELGILLFCSPGFCGVGCLLRALSSSGG